MIEGFYHIPPWLLATVMILIFEIFSLGGLLLVRRYVLPRLHFHDGVNDAISGTVQSIGVFYGITVGLIAVGAWTNYQNSLGLVSQEAAAIGVLYRDAGGYAEPTRTQLQTSLRDYTENLINVTWPAQQRGQILSTNVAVVTDIQTTLLAFEPTTENQKIIQAETLSAFNNLVNARRLRIDAVRGELSPVMWSVIWLGAAITIAVGFFFFIEDPKLHMVLTGLTAAFIGIVLFVIVINSRPFVGGFSIQPDSYRVILDAMNMVSR
jgi:hypothetical protein